MFKDMSLLIFNGLHLAGDIDTTNLYSMEETISKETRFQGSWVF